MITDPTKARVIELLHQWCDDPPETGLDAINELKDVLYPTKKERDEAEFETWFQEWLESEMKRFGLSISGDAAKMGETEKIKRGARFKLKQAWFASRGIKKI